MIRKTLLPEHRGMPKKDVYSVGQASALLNVSTKSLQRWDVSGRLKAFRTSTNRRYYTRKQLEAFVEVMTNEEV